MPDYIIKKVALVTGGARGIGESIVNNLISSGYRVAFTYNNSEENAMKMINEFNKDGSLNAIAIETDIRDYKSIKNAVKNVISVYGRVDVLVNNAGIADYTLMMDTDLIKWNNMISVNLDSIFKFCHEIVPYMLTEGGSIINISSVWGIYGGSGEVAYSASKAGIIGFTKALSKEVGLNNIRVNAIAPGVIDTDMCKDIDDDIINELKEKTALGRIGKSCEVANVVEFLAGEKSSFITGTVIEVSGNFNC